MKSIFSQIADHSMTSTNCSACLNDLPDLIHKNTGWDYGFTQTDTGCFLKPTFRNMPYRNSFVPEIDVVLSRKDTQTILCMRGQPVKFVRIFMAVWFSCSMMMQVALLAIAFTENMDTLFPVFIPLVLCVFGYLLCKIGTKATFKSIVKAIQKELK